MADQPRTIAPANTENAGSGKSVAATIAGFLILALLVALGFVWYASHHTASATPQHGPSGVGGETAGDKGGKK